MGAQAQDDPATFCRRMYPLLAGGLSLYTGDRLVAEELAQEALVRVLERWERLPSVRSLDAWTWQVALNLSRSRWRRLAVERRARKRMEERLLAPQPDEDRASHIAVRAAVAELPPRQRAVVVLRFFVDLDVEETATLLRCAPGTVKAHTAKATATLRRRLSITDTEEVPDHA